MLMHPYVKELNFYQFKILKFNWKKLPKNFRHIGNDVAARRDAQLYKNY